MRSLRHGPTITAWTTADSTYRTALYPVVISNISMSTSPAAVDSSYYLYSPFGRSSLVRTDLSAVYKEESLIRPSVVYAELRL